MLDFLRYIGKKNIYPIIYIVLQMPPPPVFSLRRMEKFEKTLDFSKEMCYNSIVIRCRRVGQRFDPFTLSKSKGRSNIRHEAEKIRQHRAADL